MTIQRAFSHARAKAAISGSPAYVVYDPDDDDGGYPKMCYRITDRWGSENLWPGCEIVATIDPDGHERS